MTTPKAVGCGVGLGLAGGSWGWLVGSWGVLGHNIRSSTYYQPKTLIVGQTEAREGGGLGQALYRAGLGGGQLGVIEGAN